MVNMEAVETSLSRPLVAMPDAEAVRQGPDVQSPCGARAAGDPRRDATARQRLARCEPSNDRPHGGDRFLGRVTRPKVREDVRTCLDDTARRAARPRNGRQRSYGSRKPRARNTRLRCIDRTSRRRCPPRRPRRRQCPRHRNRTPRVLARRPCRPVVPRNGAATSTTDTRGSDPPPLSQFDALRRQQQRILHRSALIDYVLAAEKRGGEPLTMGDALAELLADITDGRARSGRSCSKLEPAVSKVDVLRRQQRRILHRSALIDYVPAGRLYTDVLSPLDTGLVPGRLSEEIVAALDERHRVAAARADVVPLGPLKPLVVSRT